MSLKLAVVAWEEYELILINRRLLRVRNPSCVKRVFELSGIFEKVSRPQYITVRYLDGSERSICWMRRVFSLAPLPTKRII